jgi:hypothetical protein
VQLHWHWSASQPQTTESTIKTTTTPGNHNNNNNTQHTTHNTQPGHGHTTFNRDKSQKPQPHKRQTPQPLLVCTLYTNPHREQRALTCDYSNTLVLACLLFLCPASRMCKQPSVQFVLLLMDLPLTHKIACVGVPFVRLLPLVCSVTPQPQQQKDLGNAVTVH